VSPSMRARAVRARAMRNAYYDALSFCRSVRFVVCEPRLVVLLIRLRLHYRYGLGSEPEVPFSIYV
jgi:hypothetical protein